MDNLLTAAEPYSRLIGVVAAVVVLGAWLAQNIYLERAKSLRDSVANAEIQYRQMMNLHRQEARQLEIYQVAASARSYAGLVAGRAGQLNTNVDLSEALEGLEEVHVTRDFIYLLSDLHQQSEKFVKVITPSESVRLAIEQQVAAGETMRQQIDAVRDSFEKAKKEILGTNMLKLDAVTPQQQERLEAEIRRTREEGRRVTAGWVDIANATFRAYDALFAEAREVLRRRQATADFARALQLWLYVIGSVIAVAGAYLQARKDIRDARDRVVQAAQASGPTAVPSPTGLGQGSPPPFSPAAPPSGGGTDGGSSGSR